MRLGTVVRYVDDTLHIARFMQDSSLNGLQVEGSRGVTKVSLAVDVSEQSIRRTARAKADLLIVHHGLFWGEVKPITGVMAVRIRLLMENGISLYAAHLPLDCHPEIGNNAALARLLEIEKPVPFGIHHGIEIGLRGTLIHPISPQRLAGKLGNLLKSDVRVFPFGPSRIRRIGIVSGGGAFLAQDAADAGCDALLTGESSHTAYHIARESSLNLICAGHYATETLGLRTLGILLRRELGLPVKFIDLPTGM